MPGSKKNKSTAKRTKSEQMALVRSRDTRPELIVRNLLSVAGVRYRLHRADLAGTPDIYIGRLKLAVFVHGCFWHGHNCNRASRPKSNVVFWDAKLTRNIARDKNVQENLRTSGVQSQVIWTCSGEAMANACAEIAQRYARVAWGT